MSHPYVLVNVGDKWFPRLKTSLQRRKPDPKPNPVVRDVINIRSRMVRPGQKIMQCVSEASGYSLDELKSPRRKRDLATWRHVAMWLTAKHTQMSTPAIGEMYGGRDHTSVLHALKKIEKQQDEFAQHIAKVEALL